MYIKPYIKIRPEFKFSVPLGNTCWSEYKTFNSIDEAIFYISRQLFGKNYTFIAIKDHPHSHNFTAEFEYINENNEKAIRRKTITIPNYDEVEAKYKIKRDLGNSWDNMRALFGYGPFIDTEEKWVYNF